MIVELPAATPVAVPDEDPIVATPVVPEVQVPPPVELLNVVVNPAHTVAVPVIDAGSAFTVNGVEFKHPVARVYVIFTVPAATPVTMPVVPMVAVEVLPLLQVPLPVASLKVLVRPTHTFAVPVIEAGIGLTVIVADMMQPVGSV